MIKGEKGKGISPFVSLVEIVWIGELVCYFLSILLDWNLNGYWISMVIDLCLYKDWSCDLRFIDEHCWIYIWASIKISDLGFSRIRLEYKIHDKSYFTIFVILSTLACRKRNSAQLLSNSVFPNSAPFGQKIYIKVVVNVHSEFQIYVYENC